MKTSLFLSTALMALLVTGAANAEKKTFVANDLAGDHEIPEVESAATGTAIFTYDTETKKLCGKITFTPTTFAGTIAHIHEGDAEKAEGGIVVELGKDFTGELKVNVTLDEEDAAKLTGGDTYVNVHTTAHDTGELRDQLTADDTAQEQTCEGESSSSSSSSSSGASSSGTGATSSSGGSSSGASSSGSTSGTSGAAAPASTDDGGCNTTGSSTGDALAFLGVLGLVAGLASKKRKKA